MIETLLFFTIFSGFLVSLLGLREMDKRHGYYPVVVSYVHRFLRCFIPIITQHLNFLELLSILLTHFYFHVWFRLIPAYMFVILFWTNIFPHMSSGPVWYVNQLGNTCPSYWWTNLLFINNFWPTQLAKEVNCRSFFVPLYSVI